jgi:hypothetical protein
MRPLLFVIAGGFLLAVTGAAAQPAANAPPAEESTAQAEPAEPRTQPIAAAVPIISEPLPAIATGAPLRLEPPKKVATPRRPPPPVSPQQQARPY